MIDNRAPCGCLIIHEQVLHRLTCMSFEEQRQARQERVRAWAEAAFGAEQAASPTQRGIRLLEEATEAFQAVGGTAELAHHLVDFVFARPVGAIGQELGGVAVCTLLLAAAVGLSADSEERREIDRILAKPVEEFSARNAAKNAAGLRASEDFR